MSVEHNIQRRVSLDDEDLPVVHFKHSTGAGEAKTYIEPQNNRLHIDSIKVNSRLRNQGIGKAILRSVKELAYETGVDIVTAQITSRESLDSMTSVFGEDSIHIRKRGDYGFVDTGEQLRPIHPASAHLRYHPNDPNTE